VILKGGQRLLARRPFHTLTGDYELLLRQIRLHELVTKEAANSDDPSSLSTEEASEITRYPVSKLRRLIRQGKVSAAKVEGQWAIDPL